MKAEVCGPAGYEDWHAMASLSLMLGAGGVLSPPQLSEWGQRVMWRWPECGAGEKQASEPH